MPAYTSIVFQFKKAANHSTFMQDFYAHLLTHGATFREVMDWCTPPNLKLEDVIDRNQAKLNEDFELGYDEHVENDYWQTYLEVENFSECRLFISNEQGAETFAFFLIIPENEAHCFSFNQLVNMSKSIWENLKPLNIQTIDELGETVSQSSICNDRKPPSATLFAIVPNECFFDDLKTEFNIERVKGGVVLTPIAV